MNTRQLYVNSFSSLLTYTHTPGSKSNLLVEDALMEETDTSRGHTPLSPIRIRSALLVEWSRLPVILLTNVTKYLPVYYVPKPPVYILPSTRPIDLSIYAVILTTSIYLLSQTNDIPLPSLSPRLTALYLTAQYLTALWPSLFLPSPLARLPPSLPTDKKIH